MSEAAALAAPFTTFKAPPPCRAAACLKGGVMRRTVSIHLRDAAHAWCMIRGWYSQWWVEAWLHEHISLHQNRLSVHHDTAQGVRERLQWHMDGTRVGGGGGDIKMAAQPHFQRPASSGGLGGASVATACMLGRSVLSCVHQTHAHQPSDLTEPEHTHAGHGMPSFQLPMVTLPPLQDQRSSTAKAELHGQA